MACAACIRLRIVAVSSLARSSSKRATIAAKSPCSQPASRGCAIGARRRSRAWATRVALPLPVEGGLAHMGLRRDGVGGQPLVAGCGPARGPPRTVAPRAQRAISPGRNCSPSPQRTFSPVMGLVLSGCSRARISKRNGIGHRPRGAIAVMTVAVDLGMLNAPSSDIASVRNRFVQTSSLDAPGVWSDDQVHRRPRAEGRRARSRPEIRPLVHATAWRWQVLWVIAIAEPMVV